MAEMTEARLGALLRETLHQEAASAPVRLTVQDVLVRRRAQRRANRARSLSLLLVAALLLVPLSAAVLLGNQPDDDGPAGYQAVLVRGLRPDDTSGDVSDLELLLASGGGETVQAARYPAALLSGFGETGHPKLSPSGRWLALALASLSTYDERLAVLDLEDPAAGPLTRLGSSFAGWGPDDTLWRAGNEPLERIEPDRGTVEVIDYRLPGEMTLWPFEGWRLPVAADGSGAVALDPQSWFSLAASRPASWATVGPDGVVEADRTFPRLARNWQVRYLDGRNGLLRVCDSDPDSFAYCPDLARGTIIATTPDGSVAEWRAAPPADEFVLDASWAADGGLWVLLDRRLPDGRRVALVHVDREGVETPGSSVAIDFGGSLTIKALAPDDSLVALDWVDEQGFHTALLEPGTGQGWLHDGQVAGFIGPGMSVTWSSAGAAAGSGQLLPSSPSAAGRRYPTLPPVSSYLEPSEPVLLEHEAPAVSGPREPEPVTLGPVTLEEGYRVALVCSGPGDVRYRIDDPPGHEWVVKHCQDGFADIRGNPMLLGSITVTVQPDADNTWRLVVYDPPPRQSPLRP